MIGRLRQWHRDRHGEAGPPRWWPGSLAGRVALLLVACLAVLLAVGGILYLHDRRQQTLEMFARDLVGRAATIAELIEATPTADRPRLLRALGGPNMRVGLRPPHLPPPGRDWWRVGDLPDEIRPLMKSLGDRPILVRLLRPWHDDPPGLRGSAEGRRFPGRGHRHRIAVLIGLNDGAWLRVGLTPGRPAWRWGPGPLTWLGLTVVLVLLCLIWAAHRMTRPLRRFAEAADRFGVDVRAAPMPEHGSRELRRASRAFNRMQDRLRRFVDDRTMMLAAISHDLRTVLTRLRLRAEFIDDPEQQQKAIADVDEMQAMLDETLGFARDDATEEAPIKTDLAALLQSLCDNLADTGQTASFDGPARLNLQCRPVALRRAFANLLDNALRYGGEATVTLRPDGEDAVVEVADRGPGIPPEMREKVFTPFFRLEGSRSRDTGGTGLGLAVARSILRRHGGDIVLADRPGGGLLARASLPLAPMD
ncbi:MAG: ATP-binding protein [Alphaproteobacteria bacterium]|nr:ATP-binding protein [Alphaproteobacteria bacterium]MDP6812009.1 ATP-binding protein [Alphaproteobacteria bacterium]